MNLGNEFSGRPADAQSALSAFSTKGPIESASSYHELLQALPVPAYTCDTHGRICSYNRALIELWGLTPDVTKDMWCGSWCLHNKDGSPLSIEQCPITLALRDARPLHNCEITIEPCDKSRRNVVFYLEPLHDSMFKGSLVLLFDVTDDRRRESELRQSESELRDFVENTSIGLHWVGPDGRILWANQAELSMLGYAREEYIGRHIAEFHADSAVIENILACLSRGERVRDQAAHLRCKDGSIRHVLINSSVLFINGEFIHTRCFTHDITDRKQMEEQRVQLLAREWAAREEAETLFEMSREFLAETHLQKLLQIVADTARELTKAQFTLFVCKRAPEGTKAAIEYAVSGVPREIMVNLGSEAHASSVASMFRDTHGTRINDLLDNHGFKDHSNRFDHLLAKYLPIRSYLDVPVVSDRKSVV